MGRRALLLSETRLGKGASTRADHPHRLEPLARRKTL